jgi:Leucine-rich repeat (LRR) protein
VTFYNVLSSINKYRRSANTFNNFQLYEEEHIFYTNPNIEDKNTIKKIQSMIKVLGLNYGTIKDLRTEYLNEKMELLELGIEKDAYQFVTAFDMIKNQN